MIRSLLFLALTAIIYTQCRDEHTDALAKTHAKPKEWKKPQEQISYSIVASKSLKKMLDSLNEEQQHIILTVNRADRGHITGPDSVLVPNDLTGDIAYYQPFPLEAKSLSDISKIIFFSYATQSFGAYEYGYLVYAGATNMGRKADPTPTGLFYTNWKAVETTSTVNDEWDLKWNVNIENKKGVGWHQYEMPGYPASHSCLRLFEEDAKQLYKWADEWKIKGTDKIVSKGIPVIVFGKYSFDGTKPWLDLIHDPKAISISEKDISKIIEPYLQEIMLEQNKREMTNGK